MKPVGIALYVRRILVKSLYTNFVTKNVDDSSQCSGSDCDMFTANHHCRYKGDGLETFKPSEEQIIFPTIIYSSRTNQHYRHV